MVRFRHWPLIVSHIVVAGIAIAAVGALQYRRKATVLPLWWKANPQVGDAEVLAASDRLAIIKTVTDSSDGRSLWIWDRVSNQILACFEETSDRGPLTELQLYRPNAPMSLVASVSVVSQTGQVSQVMCSTGVNLIGPRNDCEIMYGTNRNAKFDRRVDQSSDSSELYLRTKGGWMKGRKTDKGYSIMVDGKWELVCLQADGFWGGY